MTYDADGLHALSPKGTMRTYTGQHIDPFTMTDADVVPADIVHSLAYQCRYNGHSTGWLSVARHSIHVAQWVERHYDMTQDDAGDTVLAALLHDAAEAYIGDMIRPLKHRPEFKFFRDLDDQITSVIYSRFDVRGGIDMIPIFYLPEIVHEADQAITLAEVNLGRFDTDRWSPQVDEADFRYALRNWRHEDFR